MTGRSGRYLQTMDMGDSVDEETGMDDKTTDPADDTVEVVIWTRDMVGIRHVTGYEETAENLFKIVVEQKQLPAESENIFSIWLVSPLLELRLKKHHIPFQFAQLWDEYCELYTDANPDEISRDEPAVMFQRNVFLTLEEEMKISNEVVLSLLYHEAKFNVIKGRYVLQAEEYNKLAGIQVLIEVLTHPERYVAKTHNLKHKEELNKFYQAHLPKPKNSKFFKFGRNRNEDVEAQEVRVQRALEEIREISDTNEDPDMGYLYKKYLEICWQYAFYGSAFFEGKVPKQLGKIMGHLPGVDKGMDVLIALNTDGICIIDLLGEEPILAVPYEDLSWHLKAYEEEEEEEKEEKGIDFLLLQCLIMNENEKTLNTKVLQVFSKQAKLMNALIDSCVKRKIHSNEMAKKAAEKRTQDGATKTGLISVPDVATKACQISVPDGATKTGLMSVPDGATKAGLISVPDGATKTGLISVPDGATKADQISVPDGATKTGLISVPDGATKAGQISVPDGATKTGLISVPDGATKAGQKSVPHGATKAGQINAPDGATKAGQVSAPDGARNGGQKSAPDGARNDGQKSAPDGARKDVIECALDRPRKYRNENFCCKISNKLDKMSLVTVSKEGKIIKPS